MSEHTNGHTLFIVGAAGYVGTMLCDQFSRRDDVARIIGLDKETMPEILKNNQKITWITANMADDSWQQEVAAAQPDVVIHTAWQIRAMYGKKELQWKWNVEGSQNVFNFAFSNPSVRKLVYFSTASSYGAKEDNRLDHFFTEAEGFRDDEYIYAKEKKVTEDNLRSLFDAKKEKGSALQVFVVRPAAITGPRGRYMRMRFGLQSALSGQLKGGITYRLVTLLTSFVPATKTWVRQFIHEDDVADIVALFSFEDLQGSYEVFNITPPGEPVYARDMAKAVDKRILPIRPWMARLAFWFFWHVTRGRIPTCPGSWRFYSYPVLMDGSKLTNQYGYEYQYRSKDAFQYTDGRYESYVPEDNRRHKDS